MSQGDMLGPKELNGSTLAAQKNQHSQQNQQCKQVHYHHQKSQDSIQRRRNQGKMICRF